MEFDWANAEVEEFDWANASIEEPAIQGEPAVEYISGLASTFGYNDPEDNGMGAWGDPTNNPDIVGVSVNAREARDYFGDEDKAHNALVEVVNPATGKTLQAPIVDKGPADWVINRQGPTVDLTEGARRALGASAGLTKIQYRIIGHPKKEDLEAADAKLAEAQKKPPSAPGFDWANAEVEEFDWANAEIDKGHGAEVPAPRPVGPAYLSDDYLKGKTVKMHVTDPETGEASEEEADAVEAQSIVRGNIEIYTTLMDCLSK